MGIPTPEIVWRLNWGHVPDKCSMTSIPLDGNRAYGMFKDSVAENVILKYEEFININPCNRSVGAFKLIFEVLPNGSQS